MCIYIFLSLPPIPSLTSFSLSGMMSLFVSMTSLVLVTSSVMTSSVLLSEDGSTTDCGISSDEPVCVCVCVCVMCVCVCDGKSMRER